MSQWIAGSDLIARRIASRTGAARLKRVGRVCKRHSYVMRPILQLIRHISLTEAATQPLVEIPQRILLRNKYPVVERSGLDTLLIEFTSGTVLLDDEHR